LVHEAVLTAEGRLEFKFEEVKEVAEMIEKAHTESEEGTFGAKLRVTIQGAS
jgi:hypothetical protein